ncbi:hypothetical protein F4557_002507 [Actinomadura catellatispora]|nr:hypothetical protein [Actinomadura catellatispora]
MRPVPRQTLHVSPVAVLVPVPLQPGQPRVAGLLCLPTFTPRPILRLAGHRADADWSGRREPPRPERSSRGG